MQSDQIGALELDELPMMSRTSIPKAPGLHAKHGSGKSCTTLASQAR
jgi:hypothetical protein